jgi:hypothetical protein
MSTLRRVCRGWIIVTPIRYLAQQFREEEGGERKLQQKVLVQGLHDPTIIHKSV